MGQLNHESDRALVQIAWDGRASGFLVAKQATTAFKVAVGCKAPPSQRWTLRSRLDRDHQEQTSDLRNKDMEFWMKAPRWSQRNDFSIDYGDRSDAIGSVLVVPGWEARAALALVSVALLVCVVALGVFWDELVPRYYFVGLQLILGAPPLAAAVSFARSLRLDPERFIIAPRLITAGVIAGLALGGTAAVIRTLVSFRSDLAANDGQKAPVAQGVSLEAGNTYVSTPGFLRAIANEMKVESVDAETGHSRRGYCETPGITRPGFARALGHRASALRCPRETWPELGDYLMGKQVAIDPQHQPKNVCFVGADGEVRSAPPRGDFEVERDSLECDQRLPAELTIRYRDQRAKVELAITEQWRASSLKGMLSITSPGDEHFDLKPAGASPSENPGLSQFAIDVGPGVSGPLRVPTWAALVHLDSSSATLSCVTRPGVAVHAERFALPDVKINALVALESKAMSSPQSLSTWREKQGANAMVAGICRPVKLDGALHLRATVDFPTPPEAWSWTLPQALGPVARLSFEGSLKGAVAGCPEARQRFGRVPIVVNGEATEGRPRAILDPSRPATEQQISTAALEGAAWMCTDLADGLALRVNYADGESRQGRLRTKAGPAPYIELLKQAPKPRRCRTQQNASNSAWEICCRPSEGQPNCSVNTSQARCLYECNSAGVCTKAGTCP